MNKEEKGSGITCDDETEVEIAVAEIIEKERAADLERKENSNTLTKKDENDKASAEEVRLKAMERLGKPKRGVQIQSVLRLHHPKVEGMPLKLFST